MTAVRLPGHLIAGCFYTETYSFMASPSIAPTASSLIHEMGSDPVASVRAGLPYDVLRRLQERLQVSEEPLARALGTSSRTLSRRRESGTLTTAESDRLVLLAEVIALAERAFDGTTGAHTWLCTPHAMLGDESPLHHMDTVTGMAEVKTMLYHIEYGMPA